MSYKQKISIVLVILSDIYHCCPDNLDAGNSSNHGIAFQLTNQGFKNKIRDRIQPQEISSALQGHEPKSPIQRHKSIQPAPCQTLGEPASPRSFEFQSARSDASCLSYQADIDDEASFVDLPTPQLLIAFEFVGKRFNEKVGYDDLYYWECKVDKLLSMMHDGYLDIDEDDIDEIRRNAPELYRKYRRQFEEYMERKIDQPLLFSESSFVLYIPEEIARGEKKQEHKEEVVIHLTSDPNLFDRVFRVVPIRERPKVSEASRIRREKQEAEYREYQRAHAEQYKAKQRALRRANGEDMIFDPRVGKKVHFEDYLRSLFLSQLAEPRSRAKQQYLSSMP